MAESIRVDPITVGAWSRAIRAGSEVVDGLGSVLYVGLTEAGVAFGDGELTLLAARAARNAHWRVQLIAAGLDHAAGGVAFLAAELVDVDARSRSEMARALDGHPGCSPKLPRGADQLLAGTDGAGSRAADFGPAEWGAAELGVADSDTAVLTTAGSGNAGLDTAGLGTVRLSTPDTCTP